MNLTPDHCAVKSPKCQTIFQAIEKRLLPVFRLDPFGVDEAMGPLSPIFL